MFQSQTVSLRKLDVNNVDMSRKLLLEVKTVREV